MQVQGNTRIIISSYLVCQLCSRIYYLNSLHSVTLASPKLISMMPNTKTMSPSVRLRFWMVIALRCVFFSILLLSGNEILPFGTSPWALTVASSFGVLAGSMLAVSALTTIGVALLGLVGYLAYHLFWTVLYLLLPSAEGQEFIPFVSQLHVNFFALVFCAACAMTWAFWRYRHTVSAEAVLLALACVRLLAAHRNYRFDMPQFVNSLAWNFRLEPLTMLILIGIGVLLFVGSYLYFASLPGRPIFTRGVSTPEVSWAPPNIAQILIFAAAIVLLALAISRELYFYYNRNAESRTTNGVGQESGESLSPLGFHSALGSTSQPAAVVRLEGDYPENPFTPMLYLREAALSVFNGKELVIGPRYLDSDVNATHPDENYTGKEDPELLARAPLVQSVFLLAEHKTAFAVDYPISIRPLKNPNPQRFKSAYRAYSVAPNFSLDQLRSVETGDPRWTEDVKKTYLLAHSDSRYAELAAEITKGVFLHAEQAFAITQYLSKTAIYTLTPGHDVGANEDPVAPFLFGDHRGYCVHFAHAIVYMLRSLGIPSRIGTGYLTDLSQSRDGHVLLRMSDRHAWAEVYFRGYGWVPFDVQPEQVESHAETDVDMNLLEELMSMLGPGEEVIPPTITNDEANVTPQDASATPMRLLLAGAVLLCLLLFLKIFLLVSWLIPGSPETVLRRGYRALLAMLSDIGFERTFGETRSEYRARLSRDYSLDTLRSGELIVRSVFSSGENRVPEMETLFSTLVNDFDGLKKIPRWKRWLATLNPFSLRFLFGMDR